MKTTHWAWAVWLLITAVAVQISAKEPAGTSLQHRWIYLSTNLLVDKNISEDIALLTRAAKAGYNGVVLTDSKFMRWDQLPEKYVQNVRRLRKACRDLKLDCIACVCPIGYSNDLLSRDPNLAEGLPVKDAPFLAKDGQLVPADDSARLENGGFEQSKNNVPAGWRFVDEPGKITFIDDAVKFEGRCSLRMQDIGLHDPQNGHGRACQTLAVKPFRYYHVSVAVKTEDFESAGEVRIAVLAKDGSDIELLPAAHRQDAGLEADRCDLQQPGVYRGQFVFGSLGRKGRQDLVGRRPASSRADWSMSSAATVRRCVVTSQDGKTFTRKARISTAPRDPKLGMVPWPGGFTAWHEPPKVTLPNGSRIKPGQKVLLSYYHTALIYDEQVMCCMAEPKVYDILRWQIHAGPQKYPAGRLFSSARRNPRARLGRKLPQVAA